VRPRTVLKQFAWDAKERRLHLQAILVINIDKAWKGIVEGCLLVTLKYI